MEKKMNLQEFKGNVYGWKEGIGHSPKLRIVRSLSGLFLMDLAAPWLQALVMIRKCFWNFSRQNLVTVTGP